MEIFAPRSALIPVNAATREDPCQIKALGASANRIPTKMIMVEKSSRPRLSNLKTDVNKFHKNTLTRLAQPFAGNEIVTPAEAQLRD
ncbi:hypothetical protein LTR96_011956 [Exophiala xenobiotica]|nr:hypothetical protein LTR41_012219 [Exophiala xenobiotica]KAK5206332.1 hypothetical protein LTR72_012517 [Exophiala xenobiotica]KAK5250180.1 hypothetical protein LTR40_011532 [Exophiala xenobiotica]KAK5259491.1 hypothetical protein LTR96_011956 [Exophiala xenobiotica]KAK5278281.1 hypothetical protein LTR14_012462 [Exophiala xenobiotica]